MQKLFLAVLLLFSTLSIAQNNAIAPGEELVFTASYNMSGLMTPIAQVKMETSAIKTSKATLLRLKCTAATFKKWDDFFKIRDIYESYVSPKSLTPYLYKRDINEGGYYKFMQYKFSHKSKTVKSTRRKIRGDGTTWEVNKTVSIGSSTKDLVTTLYHLRTIDFSNLSVGTTKTLTVIFDNKETKVNFKYLGTETIASAIGKKACYKLSISINNSNILEGSGNNLLWLTADENKVPVRAKFKIPVGNGELNIKSATGLKH